MSTAIQVPVHKQIFFHSDLKYDLICLLFCSLGTGQNVQGEGGAEHFEMRC